MNEEQKKFLKTLFKNQRHYFLILSIGAIVTNLLNAYIKIGVDFFQHFCWALICANFFAIRNLEDRVFEHYKEFMEEKIKNEIAKILGCKNDKV